jgi:hypothetical protein
MPQAALAFSIAGAWSKVSAGGLSPARFAPCAKNPPSDETINKQLAA